MVVRSRWGTTGGWIVAQTAQQTVDVPSISKGGTRAPRLDIACFLMPSRQKNGVSRASSASIFIPHERDGQEEQSSPDTEDLGQRPNFEANVGSEVVCIALAVYR